MQTAPSHTENTFDEWSALPFFSLGIHRFGASGRNYVLLYPAGASEDEDVELQAYAYIENEDGTEGELEQIETDAEWDMIEEVFNTFMAEEE